MPDPSTSGGLAAMRVDYDMPPFDVRDLAPTWHEQLVAWLAAAATAGLPEPNAMVLATADEAGVPSSRTVLCKGVDARGVVLYTNLTSAKSHDIRMTRVASATFPLYAMHRQVHVRGGVEEVSTAESDAYWATRPRGSQLGGWASAQSSVVASRLALEDAVVAADRRFPGEVPRPPHWGGWRIVPDRVEFWQGRHDRLHDRLRFERDGDDHSWRVRRLAP
ncbi:MULTISPECIES: pyridoxamine 5'-phosphate oxidase [Pseudonocardia]|uniref:Pyridoxine/pyridoxamine 5'-phosphate oxidase n=1 Tax=Pseudonocardia dioxanivorans (strain ATCC 55486 / DSM 44775 / JCM 13855 / CB1190) TaxID=675635 RepID=F4CTR5_PSEUX|nr:pyridoxamine 5'-phosphate oxidase [Pseudonocardia dioxanivorans]AEA22874.1 Pyridoxine/pyridoxamine 5'-phosphate oxidase [Pseudonocardia dioxanivorans CB1190]GJF06762.1 pyridoxine/pyridoxamine 5'-phosphate oxidase [Pseudonocardia sp. D17]